MRLYAPAGTVETLERFLAIPEVADAMVEHRVLPERAAQTAPFPDWMDKRLVRALHAQGIEMLYTHQAESLEALKRGEDIVVVTPTASGKSLCYDLPVLQSVIDDPAARALYLFPTKALSQDRLAVFRELAQAAEIDIQAGVYDGDTPAPIRSVVRSAGQVVVTNPDMLHTAILPHHTKWFQLFEQLQYIVVDEAHSYRGIFGSHVANVLRRLLRLCAHYGSTPQIVCCSATIGNPRVLAETLTGRPVTVIDNNGAPAGEKHIVVLNPPLLDRRTGIRPGALGLARSAALAFLRAGRQTIVFGRSRVGVELLLTGLREALREGRGPLSRVRGYRGGYLPTERRAIESGLRTGEVLGVVSTNALELGIDIGRLDAAILAGYPGTIAGTWQQMGRSGRRREASAAILVAGAGPLDQYVATHPEYLFESPVEEARLDPTNLHVLLAHVRAATFELPFAPGDLLAGVPTDELLAFLAEEGHVRQADDGRWYWASENFPASEISLRVAAPENVVIIDTLGHPRPVVIGEVDLFSARTLGPRERDLPARVAPVPRRSARLGREARLRAAGRRRLLHAGGAGGHAQTARDVRRGWRRRAGRGRTRARRGDGVEPRDDLQEAAPRDPREPGLGQDPSARDRAAHDCLLDRAGAVGGGRMAARRAGRGAGRCRARAADRRVGAVDGRPARPGHGRPGSLAARGATGGLPV